MELTILHAIQSVASPILDYLFLFFTLLGEQYAAILVLTVVYWLWDKETGEYMSFALIGSLCVNGTVKNIFQLPRPIGEEGVRTLRSHTATGYSFPSGHSQTAATLYGSIAWRVRRVSVFVAAAVISLLVGLSRLYLGVHWPKDVLVGLVLGGAISYLVFWAFGRLNEHGRETMYTLTAAVATPVAILFGDEDFVKTAGLLMGFVIGVYFEHRYVNFTTHVTPHKKLLRWVLGLAVLGVIKLGLSLLLPDIRVLMALEYAAVAFGAFFVCPLLFKKLHL